MRVRYKIWLENDKGKVFGEGPHDILNRIRRTGSLRQAALEIKMSYSQAWNLMKDLEKKLGFKLLKRKIGGTDGGGSELTEDAIMLQKKYKIFCQKASKQIDAVYRDVFENK